MHILFINGSPNKQGNTAALAAELLNGKAYETLNLTDLTIGSYSQSLPGDGLNTVIAAMGGGHHRHRLAGVLAQSLRQRPNVLDRFYGRMEKGALAGWRLFFLFQGAAPEKWMLEAGEYTMKRFASLYGMTWMGMATSRQEAATLGKEV